MTDMEGGKEIGKDDERGQERMITLKGDVMTEESAIVVAGVWIGRGIKKEMRAERTLGGELEELAKGDRQS